MEWFKGQFRLAAGIVMERDGHTNDCTQNCMCEHCYRLVQLQAFGKSGSHKNNHAWAILIVAREETNYPCI